MKKPEFGVISHCVANRWAPPDGGYLADISQKNGKYGRNFAARRRFFAQFMHKNNGFIVFLRRRRQKSEKKWKIVCFLEKLCYTCQCRQLFL
ncbi:MAG: hypothetical protein HAW59_02560 [Betaproteobacteria bacterium]|nr:hypothetical protein [Betaproteobacteria bacterium]